MQSSVLAADDISLRGVVRKDQMRKDRLVWSYWGRFTRSSVSTFVSRGSKARYRCVSATRCGTFRTSVARIVHEI